MRRENVKRVVANEAGRGDVGGKDVIAEGRVFDGEEEECLPSLMGGVEV